MTIKTKLLMAAMAATMTGSVFANANKSGRGGWHAKKNYTQNSTIFTTVACMYRI